MCPAVETAAAVISEIAQLSLSQLCPVSAGNLISY